MFLKTVALQTIRRKLFRGVVYDEEEFYSYYNIFFKKVNSVINDIACCKLFNNNDLFNLVKNSVKKYIFIDYYIVSVIYYC